MLIKRTKIALMALVIVSLSLIGCAPAVTPTPPPVGDERPFEGVTIVAFGDAGHNLNPLKWHADEIRDKYGIEIETVGVPFGAVYSELKTEFVAATGAYDLVIFFPAFLTEFASLGYLRSLDEFAARADWDPKLDDVPDVFRELYLKFDGRLYALPYDGDVLNLYYRTDLFTDPTEMANFRAQFGYDLQPPDTWEQYLDIAEFFTREAGETLAGEVLAADFYGTAEFGARGFSYAWWLARFGSLGGVYFDEDMRPMINSPAGVQALDHFKESLRFAPPDVLAFGYEEVKVAYLEGMTAMVIQWSDIQKKAQDPRISDIVDRSGIALIPGSMVGDEIVRTAPMPVGRVLAVPATARNPEAAYLVARHLSVETSLHDVSSPETGLDPYRKSHFANPEAFAALLGTTEIARAYLEVVGANLAHGFPELNIPGAATYLDTLDLYISKALAGELTSQAALDAAAAEWDAITTRLGAETQKEIWLRTVETWQRLGLWR